VTRFATICCLSFNRPEFVEEAITSAVGNAGMPVEVIVHDDGSDDRTVAQLLSLRERGLISTLLLNQEGHNEGQGIALNRMFSMAKGDPIVKFDHDLLCQPGWLGQAAHVLDNNVDRVYEPNIGALGLFHYHVEPVVASEMFIRAHDGWEEHRDFVGSCMVIPRRAWEKFGPFQERSEAFAEDHDFKMRIAAEPEWACGLLPHDLIVNQGFGLGPSTVVVEKDGQLTSREIQNETYLCRSS
jgi:glycosyltransferase involved in cell wall biosynthesis